MRAITPQTVQGVAIQLGMYNMREYVSFNLHVFMNNIVCLKVHPPMEGYLHETLLY